MESVAIIGGGFSGTMTAVNLARLSTRPLKIYLINSGRPWGQGIAYSTTRAEHLLNVPARNMSAFPDDPNHLLHWLRTRPEYADTPDSILRETFIPRRVYGEYLRSLSLKYFKPTDTQPQAQVEIIDDFAIDIAERPDGVTIALKVGQPIHVNRVVLATGNQLPAPMPSASNPFSHPSYFANPWFDWSEHLTNPDRDVILLGTGLTMVDAFLTLSESNLRGVIHAVSRNGQVPESHFPGFEYPDFPPPEPEKLGLSQLAELMTYHCNRLKQTGSNPAVCVDKLRPHTQRIWQRFTLEEKKEFCSRYASRWGVVRHRIAPQIHSRLMAAIAAGELRIHQGKIVDMIAKPQGIGVMIQDGQGKQEQLEGGLVINCTGPQVSFVASADVFFNSLLKQGFVRADSLDMGVDVDADFAVIDSKGQRSRFLHAMGPLLKGTLWETIAVPELRGQAMRVAQSLLEGLHPLSE